MLTYIRTNNPELQQVQYQISHPGGLRRRLIVLKTKDRKWTDVDVHLESIAETPLTAEGALKILRSEGYYSITVVTNNTHAEQIAKLTSAQHLVQLNMKKDIATRQIMQTKRTPFFQRVSPMDTRVIFYVDRRPGSVKSVQYWKADSSWWFYINSNFSKVGTRIRISPKDAIECIRAGVISIQVFTSFDFLSQTPRNESRPAAE